MWVSVRQWNGHGSDAARAHGPRQSRPFFSVMYRDGVTRAIQVTPPSLGQCLSSERPEQKFPEVSIDRCVSPGVDRSLWDESSSPSTSDLRLEVCGGTDNRKLRLCGSPVCDEHEATERGQRSSRGVGPLRCVGGKKDATNRWVSRVVGEYMCVCLRVSVCVCMQVGVQEHSSPMRWQVRPTLRSSFTIFSTASSRPRPRWSNIQSCCSGNRCNMQNT